MLKGQTIDAGLVELQGSTRCLDGTAARRLPALLSSPPVPIGLRVLEGIVGAALVAVLLLDVFQSVIVPRPTGYRFRVSGRVSHRLAGAGVRSRSGTTTPNGARTSSGRTRRSSSSSTSRSGSAALIFGYGILLYALHGLRPAHVVPGHALLRGDVAADDRLRRHRPRTAATKILAIIAGASGFGVVAVSRRSFPIVRRVPAARELRRHVRAEGRRSAVGRDAARDLRAPRHRRGTSGAVRGRRQRWAALVLEQHLAYPILAYFRSTHDYESWVGVLGALLDSSTLLMTTVTDGPFGQAKLMNDLGRHLTHDLVDYFGLDTGVAVGIEREEFDAARRRLAEAGYEVRDGDDAWPEFAKTRATYATALNAMARHFDVPPAQWVGDRSLLPEGHFTVLARRARPWRAR